tara:strand:+ start:4434 stop:4751 length:318 start_codon:yes stop_codon:yes gene_type:complete
MDTFTQEEVNVLSNILDKYVDKETKQKIMEDVAKKPVVTYSQVTWKYKEADHYHGEYDMDYESAQTMYTELIENESYALEWVVWEKVVNDGEDFEDVERWDNSIE